MIGNDIVDLEAARRESNWRRKGYLSKIFSEEEKKTIQESQDPEQLVWLFWSMKEAAYKAHQRKLQLSRSYIPVNYVCTVISSENGLASGMVRCGEYFYFTNTIIEKGFIHTTASSSEEEEIIIKILPSSEDLKSSFISHFARLYNILKFGLSITKTKESIPVLTRGNETLNCAFSLSHHGKFSAYTLSLTNY